MDWVNDIDALNNRRWMPRLKNAVLRNLKKTSDAAYEEFMAAMSAHPHAPHFGDRTKKRRPEN